MKKCAIVYASYHHNNTEKLVRAIQAKFPEIVLIDALKAELINLESYEVIGFASGIYFFNFHKKILRFVENNLPERKKIFLLCTCGEKSERYFNKISKLIKDKAGTVVGKFSAFGWDTYGPLRMIIGLKEGHPDEKEIEEAIKFTEGFIN